MSNANNPTGTNGSTIEAIKPVVLDELGQNAIRILARNVDAYKNLSANEVAEVLLKKAIRGACNAEFESKPKAAFKAKQAVDRKVGDMSTATFNDYTKKLFRDMYETYNKLLSDLKTYGEVAK